MRSHTHRHTNTRKNLLAHSLIMMPCRVRVGGHNIDSWRCLQLRHYADGSSDEAKADGREIQRQYEHEAMGGSSLWQLFNGDS